MANTHTALLINSEALLLEGGNVNEPLLDVIYKSDIHNVFLLAEPNLADTLKNLQGVNRDYRNIVKLRSFVSLNLCMDLHKVHPVITPADCAYDKGLGQAYEDLFVPHEIHGLIKEPTEAVELFDQLTQQSLNTGKKSGLKLMLNYFFSHLPEDITECIYIDTNPDNLKKFTKIAQRTMPFKWATMLIEYPPSNEMYEGAVLKQELDDFLLAQPTPASAQELYNQFLKVTYQNELDIARSALTYPLQREALVDLKNRQSDLASEISEVLIKMEAIRSGTPSTDDLYLLTNFLEVTATFITSPNKNLEEYRAICSLDTSVRGPAWSSLRTMMQLLGKTVAENADLPSGGFVVVDTSPEKATETTALTKRLTSESSLYDLRAMLRSVKKIIAKKTGLSSRGYAELSAIKSHFLATRYGTFQEDFVPQTGQYHDNSEDLTAVMLEIQKDRKDDLTALEITPLEAILTGQHVAGGDYTSATSSPPSAAALKPTIGGWKTPLKGRMNKHQNGTGIFGVKRSDFSSISSAALPPTGITKPSKEATHSVRAKVPLSTLFPRGLRHLGQLQRALAAPPRETTLTLAGNKASSYSGK